MRKLHMILAAALIMVITGCTPGGWGTGTPSGKAFKTFTFPNSTETTIDEDAHTIAVTLPDGTTDVTALVATFTTSPGASVDVNGTEQVSGTTENDFTSPVVYTVTAADGSKQDYTVTVTVAWTQKADFGGIERQAAVGFSIGSMGYIGTGYDGTEYKNDFWEYNPVRNTWTQKADFGGTARVDAVGFSIGSKGYIGTGYDGANTNDFWEYNPVRNAWTQKADFGGTARQAAVGFFIGSKGYIGTGYDGANTNDFWEYDPVLNTWTQRANFGGSARYNAVGFSIGDKGYIGTGAYYGFFTYYKDFWEYNPGSDTWTQKANLDSPLPFGGERSAAVGFSIGSKGYIGTGTRVYLIWGIFPVTYYWQDFYEYDQTADTWTIKTSFPSPRYDAVGFSIGSKGYIGTGYISASSTVYYKDFWEYTPGP